MTISPFGGFLSAAFYQTFFFLGGVCVCVYVSRKNCLGGGGGGTHSFTKNAVLDF